VESRRGSDGGKILGGPVFEASEEAGSSQNRVYWPITTVAAWKLGLTHTQGKMSTIFNGFRLVHVFYRCSYIAIALFFQRFCRISASTLGSETNRLLLKLQILVLRERGVRFPPEPLLLHFLLVFHFLCIAHVPGVSGT